MIRLLFPRISFSGRLDRTGFWREIMVSAITTPIAVGLMTYLMHETARAAEQGLVVDHVRAKAIAGLLLSAFAVRNTLVFAGVVRRRMNDLGLSCGRAFKPGLPLLLIIAILGGLMVFRQAPATGDMRAAMGLLGVALTVAIVWQALRAVRMWFDILFGPSGARADGRPARAPGETLTGAVRRDIQRAILDARGALDRQRGVWGGQIATLTGTLDRAPAARGAETIRRQQVADASAGRPMVRSGPVVQAVQHRPTTGRSRWYSGLVHGPWG